MSLSSNCADPFASFTVNFIGVAVACMPPTPPIISLFFLSFSQYFFYEVNAKQLRSMITVGTRRQLACRLSSRWRVGQVRHQAISLGTNSPRPKGASAQADFCNSSKNRRQVGQVRHQAVSLGTNLPRPRGTNAQADFCNSSENMHPSTQGLLSASAQANFCNNSENKQRVRYLGSQPRD